MGLTLKQAIDVPPIWLLGFAVLVWVLGRMLPMPLGIHAVQILGTGLVALGILVILLAAVQFQRHKTTIIPHLTASHLLTSGLFGVSRNPIYLADAIILAGLCLRWDNLHGLILVPVFMWIIQSRFIVTEEQRLRATFGDAFEAYATKVRRWI